LKVVTSLASKFAVRSGGHNPSPGFASIGSEGVLLDLSDINQITLSSDKSYVSLGPGGTWENVYKELEKFQLTVVGGRVAGVGVGGLILGGTYSF
jgi:FAD/FMN-containing dehydrogenase